MSEIVINYKSSAIASMDASGTKTLLTSGKYCEDNIEVVYSRPSGAQIDALSVTQNGTYTAQTGHAYSPVTVAVPTPLIVTLEWDSNQSKWLPDKTFSEISAAYTAGRTIAVDTEEVSGDVAADGEMSNGAFCYWVRQYLSDAPYVTDTILEQGYVMNSLGTELDYEATYPYPNLESVTITPSESQQSVSYDSTAYTGIDTVTVNAISSSYVGSGITRMSSSDLTVSGATVTAPSGYYSSSASKSVASMTLPSTTSNSEVGTKKADIFPSTSGTTYLNIPVGYNSTAQHYKIRALMLDYKPITANGTYSAASDDLDGFSSVIVNVPTVTITQSGSNLSIV